MASGFTAAQTGRTHDRTRPMLQQVRKYMEGAEIPQCGSPLAHHVCFRLGPHRQHPRPYVRPGLARPAAKQGDAYAYGSDP